MPESNIVQSLSSLKKRRFLLLSMLIIVGTVVLVGVSVVQVSTVLKIRSDYVAEKQKIEEVRKQAAQIEAIVNSPEFAQSQGIVDKALPSEKPFLELLANLDLVGRATSVAISDLSISPGQLASESATQVQSRTNSDYDILELSYQVTSSFDAFREFMQVMEKVAPFTTITNFEIADKNGSLEEGQTASASSQLVTVEVTSHTYFFTKPPTANSAAIQSIDDAKRRVLAEVEQLQSVDLPVQNTITGGGREDLFGIEGYKDIIPNLR